jgi:hypothetical protein
MQNHSFVVTVTNDSELQKAPTTISARFNYAAILSPVPLEVQHPNRSPRRCPARRLRTVY